MSSARHAAPHSVPFRHRRWSRVIAIGAVAAVIGISVTASLGLRTAMNDLVSAIPGRDATAHMLLFGGVAMLCTAAFGRPRAWRRWRRLVAIMLAVAFVDECVQLVLPLRAFSPIDMAANTIGILGGAALAQWSVSRRVKSGEPVKLG